MTRIAFRLGYLANTSLAHLTVASRGAHCRTITIQSVLPALKQMVAIGDVALLHHAAEGRPALEIRLREVRVHARAARRESPCGV